MSGAKRVERLIENQASPLGVERSVIAGVGGDLDHGLLRDRLQLRFGLWFGLGLGSGSGSASATGSGSGSAPARLGDRLRDGLRDRLLALERGPPRPAPPQPVAAGTARPRSLVGAPLPPASRLPWTRAPPPPARRPAPPPRPPPKPRPPAPPSPAPAPAHRLRFRLWFGLGLGLRLGLRFPLGQLRPQRHLGAPPGGLYRHGAARVLALPGDGVLRFQLRDGDLAERAEVLREAFDLAQLLPQLRR